MKIAVTNNNPVGSTTLLPIGKSTEFTARQKKKKKKENTTSIT